MSFEVLFSPQSLRWLHLAVIGLPFVFALLLAMFGQRYKLARRVAGLLSSLHVALAIFVAVPAVIFLQEYAKIPDRTKFAPTAVPGDTGKASLIGASGGEEHQTNWNLFFVGTPVEGAPPPALQAFFGLDGINLWLMLLTSIMCYMAVLSSWLFAREKAGGFYAWLFLLQGFVQAAFSSFDILLFYIFFELTLIPAFFLIGGWGVGSSKREAARKFFLYTLLGGLFTLIGIIGVVTTNPTLDRVAFSKPSETIQPDLPQTTLTFDVNRLMQNISERRIAYEAWLEQCDTAIQTKAWQTNQNTPRAGWREADYLRQREVALAAQSQHHAVQAWFFFALIAGFVVKVPLVPFHTWLPSAYAEAPASVTLLFSALLAKLGTLGMLRFAIPLFPDAAVAYGLPIFGVLGAIGVVYAACCAFAQKDIKLMMAYSSVSHLGLLILGLFALNTEGLTGATLHMVNHGLSAGAMFALLGFLFDRYRTTDRTQFGGLLGKYPRFAFFMVVLCLASIGLPGLNNFISEMMLLSALFTPWNHGLHGLGLAVAGAAGLFLSAWYTMTMLKIVFFGPLKEPQTVEGAPTGDLTSREWTAFAVPAVLCLALGIYPQPVIDSMQGDLGVIARRLDEARQRANPDLAAEEAPKRAPVSIRDEAERRGMGGMLPPIGGAGAGAGQGAGGRPGGGGGGPPALPSPPGGGQ